MTADNTRGPPREQPVHRTRRSVYDIVTERVIALLEQGTVPWRRPWTTGLPANVVSRQEYRGVNAFLLAFSGYASPWWLTYKQARALGGHVRKGETATPVVFWKWPERNDEDDEQRPKPVIRYYRVFNLEQCDGILGEKVPENAAIPKEPVQAAEAVVTGMVNPPRIMHGHPEASYTPTSDTIRLPDRNRFETTETYYGTLFHELTHATGHPSRLNRLDPTKPAPFGSEDYSKEELIAEMGAAFLCAHTGIQNTVKNSAAYIEGWLKHLKDDKTLIVSAAAQAQKAADFLLGRQIGVSDPQTQCRPEKIISDG